MMALLVRIWHWFCEPATEERLEEMRRLGDGMDPYSTW